MPDNNNGSPFTKYFRRSEISSSSLDDDKNGKVSMSKETAKWLSKMTLEVNKLPYSNSKNLGLYGFDKRELEWYYKEIRLLVDKVLDILECPLCEDTVKLAVMPGCGCDNPVTCCSSCWLEGGSCCPSCKQQTSSLPFEQVDDIIKECHLFLKEKAYHVGVKCGETELKRICESYFQFIKQTELLLMCNYCFGTLENTKTVNGGNGTRSPVCTGCHEVYMEFYKLSNDVSTYPSFDRLNKEYTQFFARILSYCARNKTKLYQDPYPNFKQPSNLRIRVLRRYRVKRTVTNVMKKSVVIAALAYVVFNLIS